MVLDRDPITKPRVTMREPDESRLLSDYGRPFDMDIGMNNAVASNLRFAADVSVRRIDKSYTSSSSSVVWCVDE